MISMRNHLVLPVTGIHSKVGLGQHLLILDLTAEEIEDIAVDGTENGKMARVMGWYRRRT